MLETIASGGLWDTVVGPVDLKTYPRTSDRRGTVVNGHLLAYADDFPGVEAGRLPGWRGDLYCPAWHHLMQSADLDLRLTGALYWRPNYASTLGFNLGGVIRRILYARFVLGFNPVSCMARGCELRLYGVSMGAA